MGNTHYQQDVVIAIDAEAKYPLHTGFFPGQVKEGCWGAYELGNSLSFINLYLEQRDRAGGNSVLP